MSADEKKIITRDQYLKAHALLYMAQKQLSKVQEYELELANILGVEPEDDYYGHVTDAIYSTYKFHELLDRLKLKS